VDVSVRGRSGKKREFTTSAQMQLRDLWEERATRTVGKRKEM
jgi:hypothetical protein